MEEIRDLPALRKSVIYLDQPAISNMMFALNPTTEQFKGGRVDPFWAELFEKLDSLTRRQLVVCPDSTVQEEESSAHKNFADLKAVYRRLSRGVSFMPPETISRFQVQLHARNWNLGNPGTEPELSIEDVTHGDVNGWTETLQIRVDHEITAETVEEIRSVRDEVHVDLLGVFKRWQDTPSLTLDSQFKVEVAAHGKSILETYARVAARQKLIVEGQLAPTSEDFIFPEEVITFHGISSDFERTGMDPTVAANRTVEYLRSPHLEHVPAVRIHALIWAALAKRASLGKKTINRGTVNDIRMLSTVLPFCDAVYVDREMHSILTENPVATRLGCRARAFSAANREDFLAYLDQILRSADPSFLRLVADVYGEASIAPDTGMFHDRGEGR